MPSIPFLTEITDVSSDLTTAKLSDITVYTSPARDTLALYVYLYKRNASNSDTQLTVDNSSPLTATYWSFALPNEDGVFVAVVFGFLQWTAGVYTLKQCSYYNGSYYRVAVASTNETPGAGTDWTLITDILSEVLNLGSDNVYITQTYNFSVAHAASGPLGDALADIGTQIKDGVCKNWNQAAQALVGGALIDSAWANFRRGDFVKSQEICDYLDAQTALTI